MRRLAFFVALLAGVSAYAGVTGDAYENALDRAAELRSQLWAAQVQATHPLVDCTRARLTAEWFYDLGKLRPYSTADELLAIDEQQASLRELNALFASRCDEERAKAAK